MTFSPLDSALLGPLFTTEAMGRAFSDAALIQAMLTAEAALARAEARYDLVPTALAEAIGRLTAGDFDPVVLGWETAVAGVPVIPFVKALQAKLGADLERHVHKGATTQDIHDTAIMLQVREALGLVAAELAAIVAALADLAEAHARTPCIGRSYGQHAAPVTFGFKVAVWLAGIVDVAGRLPDLRRTALRASLGGPVGTLAALGDKGPAVAEAFAWDLGLASSPVAWHTRRSGMVEIGAWLAMLIGALAKVGGDVANLASTEVAEVAEPYLPGRGGSSAMPHKRNPVSSTLILAAASVSQGLVAPLLSSMVAAHERPVGDWHAEWHVLPQLFGLAAGALREARVLAQGLEIDSARMARNIDLTQGLIFADAAAASLASRMGREKAHALVEAAASAARKKGLPLRAALRNRSEFPADVDEAAFERAFDIGPAIESGARWVAPVAASARAIARTLSV